MGQSCSGWGLSILLMGSGYLSQWGHYINVDFPFHSCLDMVLYPK